MIVEDYGWEIGNTGDKIVVPAGFVTDYASIPKWAWYLVAPRGPYNRAALIHDYLYWAQSCTRKQADRLFFIAMMESEDVREIHSLYSGVDIGGSSAWNENEAARGKGLPKVVPIEHRAFGARQKWVNHQVELFDAGVRDPKFEEAPAYCKHGDSLVVPRKEPEFKLEIQL